ncbi:TRAP transporter substrate-binding protein [Paracoccus sediminicola]|uniref:TRAP transporter substrate-binding protein n=1 Tax=Paracoccus sediminicola TaxID=3017783 RepID=UPI0022F121E7|nr:TRAP transporter substrate-binding protein [Paracoccus sediminicola]WBU56116.1 TRAP transporter substrate-binding protein [Paracoccus sediminicola]
MPLAIQRRAAVALITTALCLPALPTLAQEYVAKIGHLESPEQSRHVMLEKVAELVKERTGGEVEFQIFPQSQLGDQRTMTEGVQLGSLEATVAPAAFLGGFNPVVSILDIPYLLPTDPEEAEALREGPFGQALLDSFDSRGVVAVAQWPNGRKQMTSNKPLESVEDFTGQKFRVMDSRVLISQFDALGASAIALPFGELYTALQTGVVDGEENPLDTIQRMKFDEVQSHLVITDHGAMEDFVLFSPMFWESLPEEHRQTITDTFREVVPELVEHKEAAVDAALEDIRSRGNVAIREADEAERQALRDATYDAAVEAYLGLAGDEGQAVIDIYEAETGE